MNHEWGSKQPKKGVQMRSKLILSVILLFGLSGVLTLAGCALSSFVESPRSVLQVAAEVAQGRAHLEELREAAKAEAERSGDAPSPSQSTTALCAIDQNDDLLIDDTEILEAVQAWVAETPIDGEYIDDATMLNAVAAWVAQMRLSCPPVVVNQPPIARFTYYPSSPQVGERITFDGSSSYDPDGEIVKYEWDFGDGLTAIGESAIHIHTYSSAGSYTIKLSVADDKGATNSTQRVITVKEKPKPNRPPIARFTYYPSHPKVGDTVTFDASASYDPDGEIVDYRWAIAATDPYRVLLLERGSDKRIITYIFSEAGDYEVSLGVGDDKGAYAEPAIAIITVEEPAPDYYTPLFRWEWPPGGPRGWEWQIKVPRSLYEYYRYEADHSPLTDGHLDYGKFVLDPHDDSIIERWGQLLTGKITGFHDELDFTLAFVQQAIDYDHMEAASWEEEILPDPFHCYDCNYPRYPIETLAEKTGDCEDTAILYASLVRSLNYRHRVALVRVDTDGDGQPNHVLAMVEVHPDWWPACPWGMKPSIWGWKGATWALAETATTRYIPLGCDPWSDPIEEHDIFESWEVSSTAAHGDGSSTQSSPNRIERREKKDA